MKDFLLVLAFILLTAFCWGVYGPVLREGTTSMGSHMRPFVCVGVAYFVIAVMAPAAILAAGGEAGRWTVSGTIWSLAAGAAGALGALGIILAFANNGQPIYVMPLVFGGAPVVNTVFTMWMGRSYKQAGPLFLAGLILVAAGAAVVLIFKPSSASSTAASLTFSQMVSVTLFVAMTALCWGIYGPVLHKGQVAMQGSRLRPLTCVGLAYFLIAVLVPVALLLTTHEEGEFTFSGTIWSLAAGAAGAIGALGIIMAFNFGGKPIYVMPLVFGGAPVINTLTTILRMSNVGEISPLFYAGLIMVVMGAATVLVFGPKAGKPAQAKAGPVHQPA